MADLPVVLAVPPVYDPQGPDAVEVNVRALNPQQNTFWIRQCSSGPLCEPGQYKACSAVPAGPAEKNIAAFHG